MLHCNINSSDITERIVSVIANTTCLHPLLHKLERYTSTLNHIGSDVLYIQATGNNLKQATLDISLLYLLVELIIENITDKAVFAGQKAQFVTAQTILGSLIVEGVEQKGLLYSVAIILKVNLYLLCLGKTLKPVDRTCCLSHLELHVAILLRLETIVFGTANQCHSAERHKQNQ